MKLGENIHLMHALCCWNQCILLWPEYQLDWIKIGNFLLTAKFLAILDNYESPSIHWVHWVYWHVGIIELLGLIELIGLIRPIEPHFAHFACWAHFAHWAP